MLLNQQNSVRVDLRAARAFARRLSRKLRLGREAFNVCFVGDGEMRRLNGQFRGKPQPTDVLSFPAEENRDLRFQIPDARGFLGDIVISVETARANARVERHGLDNEIRWLILHGVLHLLGFDHERDQGEMEAMEMKLRDALGI